MEKTQNAVTGTVLGVRSGVGIDNIQITHVEKFLGFDRIEGRPKSHRIRPTASPEFGVIIRNTSGEYVEQDACIVVSTVPESGDEPLPGPVAAVAMTIIDDQEWYFLILHDEKFGSVPRPSDNIVRYDGEPEDLLEMTDLFDEE